MVNHRFMFEQRESQSSLKSESQIISTDAVSTIKFVFGNKAAKQDEHCWKVSPIWGEYFVLC